MDWEFGGSKGETGIRKNENMLLLRDKRHVFVYIEHLLKLPTPIGVLNLEKSIL